MKQVWKLRVFPTEQQVLDVYKWYLIHFRDFLLFWWKVEKGNLKGSVYYFQVVDLGVR